MMQAIDVISTTAYGYPYKLVVVPNELSTAGDGVTYSPTNPATCVSQRLTSGELVFRPCFGNYRAEQDGPTEFRYFIVPHNNGFDGDLTI